MIMVMMIAVLHRIIVTWTAGLSLWKAFVAADVASWNRIIAVVCIIHPSTAAYRAA